MLNRSPQALHPDLLAVFTGALKAYEAVYPNYPKISLNETSRSEAVQTAYHAQGRRPLAQINALRHQAGLPAIGMPEAGEVITKAVYGQSAHNFMPSRAFDSQATDANGGYLGNSQHYRLFWTFVQREAKRLGIAVTWGGNWEDWPHVELTNWRTM